MQNHPKKTQLKPRHARTLKGCVYTQNQILNQTKS